MAEAAKHDLDEALPALAEAMKVTLWQSWKKSWGCAEFNYLVTFNV